MSYSIYTKEKVDNLLNGKLNNSGGILVGGIVSETDSPLTVSDNKYSITIKGGYTGASLTLYGGENAANAGCFKIQTVNGLTSVSSTMFGTPDGRLTWNNNPIGISGVNIETPIAFDDAIFDSEYSSTDFKGFSTETKLFLCSGDLRYTTGVTALVETTLYATSSIVSVIQKALLLDSDEPYTREYIRIGTLDTTVVASRAPKTNKDKITWDTWSY